MSDAVVWNEIGNIYLSIGSTEDAIAAYTKAIEINPDSGLSYSNLGHAYFLTGEYGHALFMFRKSIQLIDSAENQVIVWNKIGDAYRALKDIENAIQAYKKADELDMGVSMPKPNAARQPGTLANFRELIKKENKIPEKSKLPSVVPIAVSSGEGSNPKTPISEGFQPENAEKTDRNIYQPQLQAESILPSLPKPINKTDQNATSTQVEKQQYPFLPTQEKDISHPLKEKSLIVIPEQKENPVHTQNEEAIHPEPEQNKESIKASNEEKIQEGKSIGQSITHSGLEDLEEILAKVNIYENITKVNPTNDRGWDTLGKLYKALGRYKDAIGAYQKAIEMAPDREVYYYYLGLLFSVEQQQNEAIQAFQQVLQKNPDYILAHSALAGVYHRMGLENKANHHIAIALPKMNNESTYNRACFYAICGDKDLAYEFLHLALKNKDTTIDWIKSDPDLDPIRSDQRYQDLISDKDRPVSENCSENYFGSDLDGKPNQILPLLNHSLER